MERKAFQAWFAQLAHLAEQQQAKVKSALEEARREVAAPEVINQRAAEVAACPHCHCSHIHRRGKEAGVQRYRCTACHKTFNAATGTPLARLKRRDAWQAYAQALIDGLAYARQPSRLAYIAPPRFVGAIASFGFLPMKTIRSYPSKRMRPTS